MILRRPDYRCDDGETLLECEEPSCGSLVSEVYFSGMRFVCRNCAAADAVPVVVEVGDASESLRDSGQAA